MICSLVALMPVFIKRVIFYGDPWQRMVGDYLGTSFFVLIAIVCVYVWANKTGMTYVEAEVLREGNEQILNSL